MKILIPLIFLCLLCRSDLGMSKKLSINNAVTFTAVATVGVLTFEGKGGNLVGEYEIEDGYVTGEFFVDLDNFKTGIELRDRHMKEKYLKTHLNPRAKLKLTKVKLHKGEFKFDGEMTLNGISKKISVTANNDGKSIKSTIIIDIKEYNIEIPSYLGVTIDKKISAKISFVYDK